MFPKEHGAYGQLLFPVLTSLWLTGATLAAVLTVIAAAAGFVSHEPLLVLLGRRGLRAARDSRRRALVWWLLSTLVAIVAGLAAIGLAPAEARWSFAWPLLPVLAVGAAIAGGRERTTLGELSVAAALSAVAIPVCRVAGASTSVAFSIALVFLGIFLVSTLAVRVVILKVRGGGDAAAVTSTRGALVVVAGVMLMGLVALAWYGVLPWVPLLAIAPSWMVSMAIAVFPPAPRQLRPIGWTLMCGSAAATLILVASLGN